MQAILKKWGPFLTVFFLWLICFRGFVTGTLSYTSDALAYIEHFGYLVEHLKQGIYPMWEPGRNDGVPVEFFLRRIGAYNPLYLILVGLSFLPVHFILAYTYFQVIYYFIGLLGFYLVARYVCSDRLAAFAAFALLAFSSLGTRLFDSYFLLVCIPMVWFFYFLLRLYHTRQPSALLGVTFCWMILLTTYIPFYFFNVLATFLLVMLFLYPPLCLRGMRGGWRFVCRYPLVTGLCGLLALAALYPGYLFFQEGGRGEIVLPQRGAGSSSGNAVGVDLKTITSWGMIEDIMYAVSFDDIRRFKWAILYVPVWSLVILCLSVINRITRRSVFLITWLLLIFLISLEHAPYYHFLHEHVFYFKYFRNLHFFLWMIILPLGVLWVTEELRKFLYLLSRARQPGWWRAYVVALHLLLLVWAMSQPYRGWSVPATILLSLGFFGFMSFSSRWKLPAQAACHLVLAVIMIQPLQAYHHFQSNTDRNRTLLYRYDLDYGPKGPADPTQLQRWKELGSTRLAADYEWTPAVPKATYYTTPWHYFLFRSIDYPVLRAYADLGFVAYDRVQRVNARELDPQIIERHYLSLENAAYVPEEYQGKMGAAGDAVAHPITGGDPWLRVLSRDVNHVRVQTNFPTEKFLVFNDSYHQDWRGTIDGQPVPLWRANVAFKGIWVPSGEHDVLWRFGAPGRYSMHIIYMALYYVMFIVLLIWLWRDRKRRRQI